LKWLTEIIASYWVSLLSKPIEPPSVSAAHQELKLLCMRESFDEINGFKTKYFFLLAWGIKGIAALLKEKAAKHAKQNESKNDPQIVWETTGTQQVQVTLPSNFLF